MTSLPDAARRFAQGAIADDPDELDEDWLADVLMRFATSRLSSLADAVSWLRAYTGDDAHFQDEASTKRRELLKVILAALSNDALLTPTAIKGSSSLADAARALLPLLDALLDPRSWERAEPPYPEAWIYCGPKQGLRDAIEGVRAALDAPPNPSAEALRGEIARLRAAIIAHHNACGHSDVLFRALSPHPGTPDE